MTAPADVFAAAIREAVHAFKPDATVVLSGTLIIEALHADEPDPVLNVLTSATCPRGCGSRCSARHYWAPNMTPMLLE